MNPKDSGNEPTEAFEPRRRGAHAAGADAPTGPIRREDRGPDPARRDESDATMAIDLPTSAPDSAREPRAPLGDAIPAMIGAYPVTGEIGRGGMGVVYLAEDPILGRKIAIKVLSESFGDAETLNRFRREARLLAALNAPNIATIHSLEQAESLVFLTMEYIEGLTLADRLRAGGLPWEEALAILRQITIALEVAHRNGIVHLDLKPANVKITTEGLVKVLDFGLAMALGRDAESGDEARTAASYQDAIAGTPGYMSPEQIQGLTLDSTADVWAFGCILYECVAGRPAVGGETAMEKLESTLDLEMDFDRLPPGVSPRMRRLLEGCLEPDRGRRLDSVTKARREIEEEIAQQSLPKISAEPAAVPNNLPHQLTRFVGRARERAEIPELLRTERLLTLTGVGGGGKTRLALETARETLDRFPGGIFLVELAPLSTSAEVAGAVLRTLRLREETGASQAGLLIRFLSGRKCLLVLDGCDHVLSGVADLTRDLLRACPDLRILATSREPLLVGGEKIYHVGSLTVPAADEVAAPRDLAMNESVDLFIARAQGVQGDFVLTEGNAAVVAQICRKLDGIPLAIELAAARVRVLAPAEILRRLDDRFRLLGSSQRTGLPHHQTLRAMIDWSYDHLSEKEQILLRRLGVFRGGWTIEAAEVVGAGDEIDEWEILDLLSHLIDRSLIETDLQGGLEADLTRYRMLETIRSYAVEKLRASGGFEDAEERHRAHFTHLAVEADAKLTGPEQGLWLRRLAADHENLTAALVVAGTGRGEPDAGWQLAGSLGRYWLMRGHWTEGRLAYAALLKEGRAHADSAARALGLNWAGNLARAQGDVAAAQTHLQESLRIRRALGDEPGVASSLLNLGNIEKDLGNYEQASALAEESLRVRMKLGDSVGTAMALNNLATIAFTRGDLEGARAHHQKALVIRREIGDRAGIAASLNNLGTVLEAMGDRGRAMTILSESLAIQRELGDRFGIAAVLANLGRLADEEGDLAAARAYLEEGLATLRKLGDRRATGICLNSLGLLALRAGDRKHARERFEEGLTAVRDVASEVETCALLRGLGMALSEEDPLLATHLLAAAEENRKRLGRQLAELESGLLRAAVEGLPARLGGSADFEREWQAGSTMSLEHARGRALRE